MMKLARVKGEEEEVRVGREDVQEIEKGEKEAENGPQEAIRGRGPICKGQAPRSAPTGNGHHRTRAQTQKGQSKGPMSPA